jgi:hypothetical protein
MQTKAVQQGRDTRSKETTGQTHKRRKSTKIEVRISGTHIVREKERRNETMVHGYEKTK